MGKSALNYIFMVYTSLLMSKQTQRSPTLYILLVKEYYNQADILPIYISIGFFSCFWNVLN